jgi:hypothetical protein
MRLFLQLPFLKKEILVFKFNIFKSKQNRVEWWRHNYSAYCAHCRIYTIYWQIHCITCALLNKCEVKLIRFFLNRFIVTSYNYTMQWPDSWCVIISYFISLSIYISLELVCQYILVNWDVLPKYGFTSV